MSRTRKYLAGLSGHYLNQAVTLLLGLWVVRFLLLEIGQEEYGLWLMVVQVLTFLDLTDLGVMALLPREIGYRTGQSETPEARQVALRLLLSGVRRITLWQVPLVAAAAVLLWLLLLGGQVDHPATGPLAVAGIGYVVLFPMRLYGATLLGLQDLWFLGLTNTGAYVAQAAISVGLVLAGVGFWGLVIGWTVARCLTAVICWCRLRTAFPEILPPSALGQVIPNSGRLMRNGLWASVGNVGVGLHYGADVLILGYFLGTGPVVIYTCTMRLITLCTFQVAGLVSVASPAISELRECGSGGPLLRVATALGQLILLTSGLVASVLLITNGSFVTWWVGPSRFGGGLLTGLVLAVMLARHLAFTLSQVLLCLGHERSLAVIVFADGAVLVVATCLLAPSLGLTAAPIGSLLGVGLVDLPLFLWLLCREPSFSLATLLAAYWPWAWRFAGVAACLGWLSTVWAPDGLVQIVATGLATAIVYAAVMLRPVVDTPLWEYLGPRLRALCDVPGVGGWLHPLLKMVARVDARIISTDVLERIYKPVEGRV